jgi:hypothetical protein
MIDKFKDSESDIKKAIQENKKAVATGKKGF